MMIRAMHKNWRLTLVIVSLLCLTAVAGGVAAVDQLEIIGPEQRADGDIPVPVLLPANESGYTAQGVGQSLQSPYQQRLAYLAVAPSGTERMEAKFYPEASPQAGRVEFNYVASVRYIINGQPLYVVTARPSSTAIGKPLRLGDAQVELTPGQMAFTSQFARRVGNDVATRKEYNVVATAKDGLIIQFISPLPTAEIIKAAQAVKLTD